MRVDRFLEARFPGLSFSHIQRIIRKGELRVNGKRAQPKDRLEAGQAVRIPPLRLDAPTPRDDAHAATHKTRAFLKSITLYEDADVLVLNKPMGLAVQGGSGTTRHLDGMLEVLRDSARRPAPAPGAPARQGHRRLPAGRQDPLCRGGARQDLPLALGAQDLLGAGRRRAEAEAGPHLDLPRQGGARGRQHHAHRPARRGGREPRGHLLRGGRDRGAEARLAVAQAGDRPHPPAARAHGAYRPSDRRRPEIFPTSRTGSCRAACRTSCICWRAGSRCRIRAAARSTSPRRCRRTCSSAGICSGFDAKRYDPIEDAPEE